MISTLLLMTFLSMPSLSMAMSSVESNHNFLVKGDKGKSHGMLQVQKKYWGQVPRTVKGQMEQHDRILLELLASCGYDINSAVSFYNGGKVNKKYVNRVTRSALQRELLSVL